MSIYSFNDYREYLQARLGDGQRNGQKQRQAEALACQAAHLSQVLKGKNHLSIEHAFGVNKFLGHTEKESEYFLNIVQAARAGTVEARRYFQEKALHVKQQSLNIKDKISSAKRELSKEEQAIYYGDGLYALAHAALSLPKIKTIEDLARLLEADLDVASSILEFLKQVQLAAEKSGKLTTGPGVTHLSSDSPHIKKHHLNMRLAGIRKIEKGAKKSDVHYSTYYTLSRQDAFRLKEKILDLIDQNLKVVVPSSEEVLYCNIIDFFEVG